MRAKSIPPFLVYVLLAVAGCSLFENEQIPECQKKEGDQSPDILTCWNTLFFTRPAWHPAGQWIAAEHADSIDADNDGVYDTWFSGIWLVHAETGETQPLLPFGDAPDWNPAGTHLAVHAGAGIYTVRISSLEPARYDTASITLLTNFDAPAFFPTWSNDGQWVAFDTNYQDEKGANVIWKIRRDGTDLTDISIHQVGEWRFPEWAKKDNKIIHSRAVTDTGWEIFVMNADGTNSRQLTSTGENYFPKFSFDGSKIIYEHRPEGLSNTIRVMDADGGNKKTIAGEWASDMTWSPDGEKIVYVFSNHFYDRPGNGQLWLMDADGSNKRQLTNFVPSTPF